MNTTTNAPLVVDLDGTLTPTDTLVESLIKVVKQSPPESAALASMAAERQSRVQGNHRRAFQYCP